ncbi:unnamed protein product [Pseudo-nitzschia multistriata]|uniref:Uncharacterized protein n=1 Tax=Pseudo-nitzschia multistriata TaxID=183589 RepID=A0A448Z3B8_9STRA|nr:unnamed protein product [Pseudo-nitzschia multistriata]
MIGRSQHHLPKVSSGDTSQCSLRGRKLSQRKTTNVGDINSTKRCFILTLAVASITFSILAIFSCSFFSYQEIDYFDNEVEKETSEAVTSYNPFEFFPAAGVGLFRYYMGDPSGMGFLMNNRMCFTYCDEFTDYQWLSSNNNNEETAHGNMDLWVVSRYCSILAPSFGLLAMIVLILEPYGFGFSGRCRGKLFRAFPFLIAAALQCGTFSVMYASPIMYSTSSEDQQQHFCFSSASNFQCRIDTGAVLSLSSAVMYSLLAVISMFSIRRTGRKECCASKIDTDDDSEDKGDIIGENSGDESEKQHEGVLQSDSNVSCESC